MAAMVMEGVVVTAVVVTAVVLLLLVVGVGDIIGAAVVEVELF